MDREEQIAARREQIPKKCKGLYDRSLKRGNLRAAVNAFCLECVGWVSDEVRRCTDLACPLYAHRKLNGKYCRINRTSDVSPSDRDDGEIAVESKKE